MTALSAIHTDIDGWFDGRKTVTRRPLRPGMYTGKRDGKAAVFNPSGSLKWCVRFRRGDMYCAKSKMWGMSTARDLQLL